MSIINKDRLLAARKLEKYEVPEWGGCIYLARMSVRDRAEFYEQQGFMDDNKRLDAARAFRIAALNENGERLFDETEYAQIEQLESAIVDKVIIKWLEINGIAAHSIESAEKN